MSIDIKKRTKGEWVARNYLHDVHIYCDAKSEGIALMKYRDFDYPEEQVQANAAFIVTACNNFEILVHEVGNLLSAIENNKDADTANANDFKIRSYMRKVKNHIESIEKETY